MVSVLIVDLPASTAMPHGNTSGLVKPLTRTPVAWGLEDARCLRQIQHDLLLDMSGGS